MARLPLLQTCCRYFKGAAPEPAGTSIVADTMMKSIVDSVRDQGLGVQVRLFSLPEGTQWDDVVGFYAAELEADGWKAMPDLSQDADSVHIAGWNRGSGAAEQTVIIGQARDPVLERSILLLGLFSESS